MSDIYTEFDLAISEAMRSRKALLSRDSKQVTAADEINQLKSTSYVWFKNHRPEVLKALGESQLAEVDGIYQSILHATARATNRTTYNKLLKAAKGALAAARTGATISPGAATTLNEPPPDFSKLAADVKMREILERRWAECQRCIAAEAYMAATVMMGGLLEALCMARANKMTDKSPLFKDKSTPTDSKTSKPLPLSEWMLKHYIDVGHHVGWFTRPTKDVGVVLRDYRNYVHPQKEYSHGIVLVAADALMFWQITKSLSRQILAS